MPKKSTLAGVSKVRFLTASSALTVPALNAVTTFAGSSTAGTFNPGTTRPKLTAGDYKFWVAPMGYDGTNGGYCLARSTPTPDDPVTVDSGEYLEIYHASPVPSNLGNALAAAIFIQKASEDPKMVDFAPIDASREFSWLVTTLGSDNANSISEAILTSATANDVTGSRTPQGADPGVAFDTTGGVRFAHSIESFQDDRDSSTAFPNVVGKATNVSFKIVGRELKLLARSLGYDYVTFTNSAGKVIEQMVGDISDIVSQLAGNGAIRITMPRQTGGRGGTRLFLGNVHANLAEVTEDEQKLQAAGIDVLLSAANLDYLLDGMGNQVGYSNG